MLRDLIDASTLEDFLTGASRAAGYGLLAFDGQRLRVAVAQPLTRFAQQSRCTPEMLPRLDHLRLPADEPPAQLAVARLDGVAYVVAPIITGQQTVGFVAVGELRDSEQTPPADEALRPAYDRLPLFEPSPGAKSVALVRWAARMLGDLCRRELQTHAVADQLTLIGDIASLLTDEKELRAILEHIVEKTAQAMGCRFSSIRLYNPETQELEMTAGHNLSDRYLSKGTLRRKANVIDDEALRGGMVYVEDATTDARYQFPEEARREGIVSVLTTGMHYHGRPVGVMRVYTDRRQRFRTRQRELLHAIASQAAVAIVNARFLQDRLRSAALERELAFAGEIQARMLTTLAPQHASVDFGHFAHPSHVVSGDFYDFVELCDGRTAVVIADVVGKGVPAALLGASLRGALRSAADNCPSLAELFGRINRHVCRETSEREFVTLLMLVVDTAGRQLEFCNAGHEPPLLLQGDDVATIEEGDLVLGLNPSEVYTAHGRALAPGDTVLLYTDGAVDAMDFAGEKFGRGRLREALQRCAALAPDEAVLNILWDIRRFIGLAEQSDDISLVALRVR